MSHRLKARRQEILFSLIAAAYAQLAIYALGLTTVWTGAFDEKKVSEILNLPKEHRPVAEFPVVKTTRGP